MAYRLEHLFVQYYEQQANVVAVRYYVLLEKYNALIGLGFRGEGFFVTFITIGINVRNFLESHAIVHFY